MNNLWDKWIDNLTILWINNKNSEIAWIIDKSKMLCKIIITIILIINTWDLTLHQKH